MFAKRLALPLIVWFSSAVLWVVGLGEFNKSYAQTITFISPASIEKYTTAPYVRWECTGSYSSARARVYRSGTLLFDTQELPIGHSGTQCSLSRPLLQPIIETIMPKPCTPTTICQIPPKLKGLHIGTQYELELTLVGSGVPALTGRHSFKIGPQIEDDFTTQQSSHWVTSGGAWDYHVGYYRGHSPAFLGRTFFLLTDHIQANTLIRYEANIFFSCSSANCYAGITTGNSGPPRPQSWLEVFIDGGKRLTAQTRGPNDQILATFLPPVDVSRFLQGRNTVRLDVEQSDRQLRIALEGTVLFCRDYLDHGAISGGAPGFVLNPSSTSDYIDVSGFRVTSSQNYDSSYLCEYNAEQN
jgi:hypothetical protein